MRDLPWDLTNKPLLLPGRSGCTNSTRIMTLQVSGSGRFPGAPRAVLSLRGFLGFSRALCRSNGAGGALPSPAAPV